MNRSRPKARQIRERKLAEDRPHLWLIRVREQSASACSPLQQALQPSPWSRQRHGINWLLLYPRGPRRIKAFGSLDFIGLLPPPVSTETSASPRVALAEIRRRRSELRLPPGSLIQSSPGSLIQSSPGSLIQSSSGRLIQSSPK